METEYVFVYGSLKRGFRLFPPHLADSEFIGAGTLNGYTLHEVQGAWYPGITDGVGFVKGEVFRVDEGKVHQLDGVEVEGSLYDRITADVELNSGDILSAFVYVFREKESLGPVINSGIWVE